MPSIILTTTWNVSAFNGFVPALTNFFVIINNDGTDGITGTFAGLPEGATVAFDGAGFAISYTGGTGNDVVLTRLGDTSRFSGIFLLADRKVELIVLGRPGVTYSIEASTNLLQWQVIGAATADPGGVFDFIDGDAPQFPGRFYRTRTP